MTTEDVCSRLVNQQYVRVPPGRSNVWVPVATRRQTLSGLSLVTASRRAGLLLQLGMFSAVWAAGPRALAGRRLPWTPPLPEQEWLTLAERIAEQVGPFDAMAVYERPQASRRGIALMLLRRDRQVAFVKLRSDGVRLAA